MEAEPLARRYLDLLLGSDRHRASVLILDAVGAGMHVRDVYLKVFQPTQREVGRLWQTNQISVAQEHFCTAATQLIMSQLYPHIFSTERNGHRMVASGSVGELHELGIRMVADFFELAGWDSCYLGANTPAADLLRSVADQQAEILALSATITYHVAALEQVVRAVRATPGLERVRVLVGGNPFNAAPELWRQVGADGWAPDAGSAVILAETLV